MATSQRSEEEAVAVLEWIVDSVSLDLVLQVYLQNQITYPNLPPSFSLHPPSRRRPSSSEVKAALSRAHDDRQSISALPRAAASLIPPNSHSSIEILQRKRRRLASCTAADDDAVAAAAAAGSSPSLQAEPAASDPYCDIWGRVVPKDPLVQCWVIPDANASSNSSSSSNKSTAANPVAPVLVMKKDVPCTKCSRRVAVSKFAAHLEKCMNLGGGTGR